MSAEDFEPHDGGCDCGQLRYRITRPPFIVHCCHCSRCQTQTGSAFVINALIDATCVETVSGEKMEIISETPSGEGQIIVRCPDCKVAVWSHYFMGGIRRGICFVRVGTLDDPNRHPPDVHIFTQTKQDWVVFPGGAHVEEIFYDYETTWSKEDYAWRMEKLAALNG